MGQLELEVTDFLILQRDIQAFLHAMRRIVNEAYVAKGTANPMTRAEYTAIMLHIEEAQLNFNTYIRFERRPNHEDWKGLGEKIHRFLSNITIERTLREFILQEPFFNYATSKIIERTTFSRSLNANSTILDALAVLRDGLDSIQLESVRNNNLSFKDILHIIPDQQLAPVKFGVENQRIVVADSIPKVLPEDQSNINFAADYIREAGFNLLQSLERSNCDRRLLDSVKELHTQIESNQNVIKIGLTNMACCTMSVQFQEELPAALYAMLNSYSTSVSLYVSQFPEWEKFTERAAAVELDQANVAEIDHTAVQVIAALNANPDLAEPEVPKTIQLVRDLMTKPGSTSKRAAFAMMRTLENLVSGIAQHVVSALNKTAEKAVDDISAAASKVFVGMLSIALLSASGIGAAAMQAGAPWVRQAAELVQKQIDDLSAK